MIQNFAAGAKFRDICDCRDRREKFTALIMACSKCHVNVQSEQLIEDRWRTFEKFRQQATVDVLPKDPDFRQMHICRVAVDMDTMDVSMDTSMDISMCG